MHTHGNVLDREVLDELRPAVRDLRRAIPGVWAAFGGLSDQAMTDGALSTKVKELIALALATAEQCDGCIAAHARGAARAGATSDEVAEALGVTILMRGGPGTVYGPRAYAAYQAFAADHPAS
ncbi:MAG: carboxymuconolactone decarboxylase family protein [Frankia sp.]|nr:carboxymuconolactone decarboxylase family protein [Frankia sp.]